MRHRNPESSCRISPSCAVVPAGTHTSCRLPSFLVGLLARALLAFGLPLTLAAGGKCAECHGTGVSFRATVVGASGPKQ